MRSVRLDARVHKRPAGGLDDEYSDDWQFDACLDYANQARRRFWGYRGIDIGMRVIATVRSGISNCGLAGSGDHR